MKHIIIIIFSLISFYSHSQSIVEGKGIDSIHLGLKKSKVIHLLGNDYKSVTYDYGHTGLVYKDKKIEVLFDKDDDVCFEIVISSGLRASTAKGLKTHEDVTVNDIFNVYGDEWSFYKDPTSNTI